MELKTLARSYAKAVFELARESGKIAQWSRMLEFLATVMANKEMARAAANPKLDAQTLLQLILELGKGYLDQEGENFVALLVLNRRITLVDQIRQLFEEYRAEYEGIAEAKVISAYPLSEEDRKALTPALERHFGKQIRLTCAEDRELIGGVVIRVRDKVIDGSVRGQLERLAKKLLA